MTSKAITKNKNDPKQLILAIDDERDCTELLELILTQQEFLVVKAFNAREAIKFLDETETLPNLILLDIKMPDIDGLTFCQKLKNNARYENIPVIILSALTFPEDIERGYQCGAVDYILKPFSNEDLIRRINYQLSRVPS